MIFGTEFLLNFQNYQQNSIGRYKFYFVSLNRTTTRLNHHCLYGYFQINIDIHVMQRTIKIQYNGDHNSQGIQTAPFDYIHDTQSPREPHYIVLQTQPTNYRLSLHTLQYLLETTVEIVFLFFWEQNEKKLFTLFQSCEEDIKAACSRMTPLLGPYGSLSAQSSSTQVSFRLVYFPLAAAPNA